MDTDRTSNMTGTVFRYVKYVVFCTLLLTFSVLTLCLMF